MKIVTQTKRFLLREFLLTDIDAFFEMDNDPQVHRFLGNSPIQTKEELIPIIENVQQQYTDNGIGRWAIEDKLTGEVVGWSGLKWEKSVRPGQPYYDLGYRLLRKYWGKGIATETSIEALRYGFEVMNLVEINAAAQVEHTASNKILNKVGFQFKETFEYDGKNTNWYSLLKQDWKNIG